MRHVLKYFLFINLIVILFAEIAIGGIVTFSKEYTYQASEFDSKASSRILALEQIKKLLLEELGTYLISETEVKNYQMTKDQITVFTAGIVRAEVIEEKWDGKTYQLKAKLSADPKEVARSVAKLKEDKRTSKELEDTRKRADDLEKEVVRLRQELTAKADGGKIKQYNNTVNKLSAIEWQQRSYSLLGDGKDVKNNNEALDAINKALELTTENPELYFARARILYFYLDSKNYDQIMADIEKAIALQPSQAEYFGLKAKIFRDRGEWHRVVQALETAIASDAYAGAGTFDVYHPDIYHPNKPKSKKDWSKRSFDTIIKKFPRDYRSYMLRGFYTQLFTEWHPYRTTSKYYDLAIADYKKAISLNPKVALVHYLLGNIYREKAYWVSASSSKNESEDDPLGLFTTEFYDQKAIDSLSRAIELNNSYMAAYRRRASIYSDLRLYDKAINDYNRILEIDPEHESIYFNRGQAQEKLKKYADAVQSFTSAISAKIHDTMLLPYSNYQARAEAYFMSGKYEESLDDYTKAIELREASIKDAAVFQQKIGLISGRNSSSDFITSDLYADRGRVYSWLGMLKSNNLEKSNSSQDALNGYQNAISDFTQAIKLWTNSSAYEARAEAYAAIRDYKNALQDIDVSLQQYAKYNANPGQLYVQRANIYVGIGNFKQAVDDYSQAIAYAKQANWGGLEVLLNARGAAYLSLNEDKKAIQDFSEAIKRAPKHTAAFVNRGAAYANLGNYKAALADFDMAVTLSPEESIAYFNRGLARISLMDDKRGIEDFKIAARLGHKDAQEYLKAQRFEW